MTMHEYNEIDRVTDLACNPTEWTKVYGKKTLAEVLTEMTGKDSTTINCGEKGKTLNGSPVVGKVAKPKTVIVARVSAEVLAVMKNKKIASKSKKVVKVAKPKLKTVTKYEYGRKIKITYDEKTGKIVEKLYCA